MTKGRSNDKKRDEKGQEGVGRKTANVIRGNVCDEQSIVVDTHVKRISRRLGLTEEEAAVKETKQKAGVRS